MLQQDTITALVTAVGESSVGIIRISGPEATNIANKIYKGKECHVVIFLQTISLNSFEIKKKEYLFVWGLP